MVMDRTCTDFSCCITFVAFIVAMIAISYYAINNGDVYRIVTPFDSDGNECGQPMQDKSAFVDARDFSEYKYKYFTGIMGVLTEDISEQYDAVCISECPVGLTGAANTYNISKLDCLVNDVVISCPFKLYNTIQMMGYCLPEPSATSDLINSVAEQLG